MWQNRLLGGVADWETDGLEDSVFSVYAVCKIVSNPLEICCNLHAGPEQIASAEGEGRRTYFVD